MYKRLSVVFCVLVIFLASFQVSWAETLNNSDLIVRNAFHDYFTGNDIYNLQINKTIYFDSKAKKWYQIDGKYGFVYMNKGERYPAVNEIPGKAFDFSTFFIDVNKQKIFQGNQYNLSPDGKWGYAQKSYGWSSTVNWVHGVLLKNLTNGNIEQPFGSPHWINIQWLPDNTLLVCKYNYDKKQNEIGIYYPKSSSFKRVTLGTLHAYFSKENLIYFVKNEPDRKPWLLNLQDNQERLVADFSEIEKRWRANITEQPAPTLPKNLDSKNITALKFTFQEQFEHKIILEGQTAVLPYVFTKNHKTFIPVRPLFKPLNMKYKIINPQQDYYKYELVYKGKKFVVDRKNSMIFQWRLYITPATLKAMGINDFLIKPNQDLKGFIPLSNLNIIKN